MTEHAIQTQICQTLRRLNMFFFKIPNEQKFKQYNPAAYASKMKAEGFRPGAPDLAVLLPNGVTLWLEVKRPAAYGIGKSGKQIIISPAGKQSSAQIEFEREVKLLGHLYYVVHSPAEAFKALEEAKKFSARSVKIGGTN